MEGAAREIEVHESEPTATARQAADHMVRERVGRLPVVDRESPRKVIGIISRSDLLAAHEPRLAAAHEAERTLRIDRAPG